MIVVLHRERSEKLAGRFIEIAGEDGTGLPQLIFGQDGREAFVRIFDGLIQDGLICEEQHRPEGRE